MSARKPRKPGVPVYDEARRESSEEATGQLLDDMPKSAA